MTSTQSNIHLLSNFAHANVANTVSISSSACAIAPTIPNWIFNFKTIWEFSFASAVSKAHGVGDVEAPLVAAATGFFFFYKINGARTQIPLKAISILFLRPDLCIYIGNCGNVTKTNTKKMAKKKNRPPNELSSIGFNHLQKCVSNKAIMHEYFFFSIRTRAPTNNCQSIRCHWIENNFGRIVSNEIISRLIDTRTSGELKCLRSSEQSVCSGK